MSALVEATKAIHLRICHKEADLDDISLAFHPFFIHQIFTTERVNAPLINIFFSPSCMHALLEIGYSGLLSESEEIAPKLHRFMHFPLSKTRDEFLLCLLEKYTPSGTLLSTYTKNGRQFEVYLSSFKDKATVEAHKRWQFFSLLYIESLSFLDSSDTVWRLLCVYERTTSGYYHFVGYMSLYSFFRFPDKNILRISQVMILPTFQKSGHGEKLLREAYSIAFKDPDCSEVNIEDPSKGCQFLRDVTDVRLCRENGVFCCQFKGNKRIPFRAEWSDAISKQVQSSLKLTPRQIRRCYEIQRLAYIDTKNEKDFTEYRLEVKRQLAKEHAEALGVLLSDTQQRKQRLRELFAERFEHYSKILSIVK